MRRKNYSMKVWWQKFGFQHLPPNYLLSNLHSENKLNLLPITMKLQLIPSQETDHYMKTK